MSPERFHTVRVLGPYGPDNEARQDAARMAEIQAAAWHAWLAEYGVSGKDIMSTLDSEDLKARELRVRQALTRDGEDAILYLGAYSTQDHMVGFAKFMISVEEERLQFYLAEIDVLPDYQGRQAEDPDDQNLARKMLYAAIAHVRDPNATIQLGVLGRNIRARRLYQRLGLQIVDDADTFSFTNAAGRVTAADEYLTMQGSLQTAKSILAEDLGVV